MQSVVIEASAVMMLQTPILCGMIDLSQNELIKAELIKACLLSTAYEHNCGFF
jgi:hypothetical protein